MHRPQRRHLGPFLAGLLAVSTCYNLPHYFEYTVVRDNVTSAVMVEDTGLKLDQETFINTR